LLYAQKFRNLTHGTAKAISGSGNIIVLKLNLIIFINYFGFSITSDEDNSS